MTDMVPTEVSADQIEQVLDGFAEQSSVEQIAHRTSISMTQVREILSNPVIIRAALLRKAGLFELWAYGKGLDRLKWIVENGRDNHSINAIKHMNDMIEKISHTPSEEIAEDVQKSLAQPAVALTIEAVVKELDD